MGNSSILSVRGLHVGFSTSTGVSSAVRGLDLELERGETLALVGASGSGKTACARAIIRLLPPNGKITGGQILYRGEDLVCLPEKRMCRIRGSHIGMVFQDPFSALNPVMKIGAQIAEAARRAEKISKVLAREKALALLEEVGIPQPRERMEQYPFQLSGGMRQRIVIAIALAMNPEILICDEPTTALDVTIQARIIRLLREIQQRRGLSMLFITHNLGVVAGIADRVAVIHDGELAEIGPCECIFYAPEHAVTNELLAAAKLEKAADWE